MYARFGKVKYIDASCSVAEVFEATKKAMLPEVFFLVGPKGSGKSIVGRELAARTNMIVVNFEDFWKSKGLDADDEEVTLALVKSLVNETAPRVLLEDFPRTETQARLFVKNCVMPSEVFYIRCSKDACQERLLEVGKSDPNYVPSSLLSKQVKRFHENAATLLPYLRASTRFNEIDGEQPLHSVLKSVYSVVEPTVIHIRTGGNASSNELRKQIIDELTSERMGYANLDVNSLIRDENERRTPIGQEFLSMVQSGKIIPAETIVRMLRKIIYSGDGRKKFILSSFPDIIDQAKEFEKTCATIAAIIYTTQDSANPADNAIVEIKNNNLTLFNIDALFQKEHRLKTMSRWDDQKWQELIGGSKVDWSIVLGLPLQGKTTLLNVISKHLGFKVVDWKQVEDAVKKTLGTDEEPFEGKVPLAKTEDAVIKMIEADRKAGQKQQYLFDSFPLHASGEVFYRFTRDKMRCGAPDYVFDIRAGGVETAMILARQKKRLEAEELNEDQQNEVRNQIDAWEGKIGDYLGQI
jgi:adenylate kinase family enzyme